MSFGAGAPFAIDAGGWAGDHLPIRFAQPRRTGLVRVAAEVWAAGFGVLRITRTAAEGDCASQSVGAWVTARSAFVDAIHPDLSYGARIIQHLALLVLWAGVLLAIAPIDGRAGRSASAILNALLAGRTSLSFAGGNAEGLWRCLVAEEARGTILQGIWPAGLAAPALLSTALQAGPAGR